MGGVAADLLRKCAPLTAVQIAQWLAR